MPNRRQFLCVTLGCTATGLSALFALRGRSPSIVGDQTQRPDAELEFITRDSTALGSNVSMALLHEDRANGEQALDAAFGELELVEQVMSLYRPQSQLCRLNRDGRLSDPHPYLVQVLQKAAEFSVSSEGAFDVTVQPLWQLFASAQKESRLPAESEIEAARRRVDWRKVEVSADLIQLHGSGTAVTLNGIAQGFALDRALDALRRHGIERALIDTGEFGALGDKTASAPWTVGIQHPRQPDAYVEVVALDGRALSTSGDYATSFSPDHSANHLFDPRTGRSPQEFSSVSIVAPTGLDADALSTAVFVLGLDSGLELVQSTPGADALLVTKEGRVLSTGGFLRL